MLISGRVGIVIICMLFVHFRMLVSVWVHARLMFGLIVIVCELYLHLGPPKDPKHRDTPLHACVPHLFDICCLLSYNCTQSHASAGAHTNTHLTRTEHQQNIHARAHTNTHAHLQTNTHTPHIPTPPHPAHPHSCTCACNNAHTLTVPTHRHTDAHKHTHEHTRITHTHRPTGKNAINNNIDSASVPMPPTHHARVDHSRLAPFMATVRGAPDQPAPVGTMRKPRRNSHTKPKKNAAGRPTKQPPEEARGRFTMPRFQLDLIYEVFDATWVNQAREPPTPPQQTVKSQPPRC